MKLIHTSDNHGDSFFYLDIIFEDADIIVNSGDFLPSITMEERWKCKNESEIHYAETIYQHKWMMDHMDAFKDTIDKSAFVLCPGNHDYYNPIPDMIKAGIDAYDINQKMKTIKGLSFYGFPFIPFIGGNWNYEKEPDDMREWVKIIPEGIDILVAHCPPANILCESFDGKDGGNAALANWLSYGCEKLPKMVLSGHFHKTHGIETYMNMKISNAATVVHSFDL